MPRPFAVLGITVFLVLSALYDAPSKRVFVFFIIFTALLTASVLFKSLRRQAAFPVAFAGAAVACLMLLCVNEFLYYPAVALDDTVHEASMTVVSDGETAYGNYYYDAKMTSLDSGRTDVNVRLVFQSAPGLSAYDEIQGNFKFYKLGSSSEDLLSSYKAENRFLGAYSVDETLKINGNTSGSHFFGKAVMSVRRAVKKSLMTILPNDYGGLSLAILLGDRSMLSDSAYRGLKECGVTHIICVSGLHLSLWSAAILWLLKRAGMREKTACALTIPAVILLMFIAGMKYSVMRAGIMMILYLLSVILSQRRDPLNSLGISLLVISIINPFSPGSLSLRLSAFSTMGIILSGEYFNPVIKEFASKHKMFRVIEKPVKLLLVTASAVGFTLPFTLGLYGGFKLSIFISNIIIVFLAEICMISAALSVPVALISPYVFNLPGLIAGVCAKSVLNLTRVIPEFPLSEITVGEKDAYMILCGLFMFGALAVLTAYSGNKIFPSAVFIAAGLFAVTALTCNLSDRAMTDITVFDSGKGSSVLVSTQGKSLLIGCGADGFRGADEISESIGKAGGGLSAIVLPYADRNYISCLQDIVPLYQPQAVYCDDSGYIPVYLPGKSIIENEEKITAGKITAEVIKDGSGNKAYYVHTDDVAALIVCDPAIDSSVLPYDADVLVCRMDYPENSAFGSLSAIVIQADESRGIPAENELSSCSVETAATAGRGKIIIHSKNRKIMLERG